MAAEGRGSPRGRPPGPSLSNEAVAILERNALAALRGPNSRGAVPRGAFVDVDVSTVDRAVNRAFPGEIWRTPFDLASQQVCGTSEATTSTMESVFAAVESSFRDADTIDTTLRVFLQANFVEACKEKGFLATSLITTAACAHLEHARGEDLGQARVAGEILAMRRRQNAELIDGFSAALTIALRRLRRRPKVGRSLHEIVVAVMAATDGFIQLHHLQPDLVRSELVVETQWGIIWSLSEPGLLNPPNRENEQERNMVEAALHAFSSDQVPSLEFLCKKCKISMEEAVELFPDDNALAQRCMDYAVGSAVEIQSIAFNLKGSELSAIRDLLMATTRQATRSPLLIEVLKRNKNDGFRAEARRHIAEALRQSSSVPLDSSTAQGVAMMLIDAAMQGDVGQHVWEAGLDAFSSPG